MGLKGNAPDAGRGRNHRVALALALSGFCWTASGQQEPPELLREVDQEAIATLMRPSNYEFRAQRYDAKRFRIVNINFDVFEETVGEFTVTPFDDLQMTIVATRGLQSYPSNESSVFSQWNGELKYPELQVVDNPSDHRMPATVRVPVVFGLTYGDHQVPLSLLRELARDRGEVDGAASFGGMPSAGTAVSGPQGFGKLSLRTLSGRWFVPALRTSIVISPIDGDPRFHIVYEEDPARVTRMLDTPTAEGIQARQKRREFMRQLEEERARALKDDPPMN